MSESSNQLSGIVVLDKPAGPTSHDVVRDVRRVVHTLLVERDRGTHHRHRKVKVGHAGTLDPFATGILLIGLGSATRLLEYAHDWHKVYEATITLGATSDTADSTGTLTEVTAALPPTLESVHQVLPQFFGTITQIPPQHSAIKVGGKKLYEYARAGQDVAAPPRQITIHALEIRSYQYPELRLRIRCEGGTYIRALARDIGEALGTGGYCSELRRTQHGDLSVDSALPIAALTPDTLAANLLPASTLLTAMTPLVLTPQQLTDVSHGRAFTIESPIVETSWIALTSPPGEVVGIGTYNAITRTITPSKVLI